MSRIGKDIKLGYDDISIIPAKTSTITSRSECNCYDELGMLPIFASPMDNVVDLNSSQVYLDNKIYPVIPRTISLDERILFMTNILEGIMDNRFFIAFSLNEAIDIFINAKTFLTTSYLREMIANSENGCRICIDLANGHMQTLLNTIQQIKYYHGNKVLIMSGNIANPKTYEEYNKAGCDYVRVNIGSGSRCTTASNTSIFYPTFSLLKEIWEIKQKIGGTCKIIADGGIKGYRDIQKALLYSDYVMIGGLFNKAIDSAGVATYGKSYWKFFDKQILNPFKTLLTYGKRVNKESLKKILKDIKKGKVEVWKEFYGMSSKMAQSRINPNAKLKTSEGLVKKQKVEYSIQQWTENEKDYLRSAMSYTNSRTLEEYQDSDWVQIAYRAYND